MSARLLWWMGALVAVWSGCSAGGNWPRPEEERRRRELREQGEELDRSVDALEERLLASQARILLWQELARRHQHVSEVVTRTHLEHVASMVVLLEKQELKARHRRYLRPAKPGTARAGLVKRSSVKRGAVPATGSAERGRSGRSTRPSAGHSCRGRNGDRTEACAAPCSPQLSSCSPATR